MARRRLAPADIGPHPDYPQDPRLPRFSGTAPPGAIPGTVPGAPIARVAADAAGTAALEEVAETLRAARAEGRLVLEIPLEDIAPDHLARDRVPGEDEGLAGLRASIRARGQRTPIEVTPLAGPLPYGLISGSRRLMALKALLAETGEARFATARALVFAPETAAAAYVAMVEENEVRTGLSYWERARAAALATSRGAFPSEEDAVRALFATASRPRRSRIRAFLALYHALDGALRFPASLPERLGLRLVERVRAGDGPAIAAALAAAQPASPEAELALLTRLAAPGTPAKAPPAELRPGVALAHRLAGGTLTLRLSGSGVTPELRAEVLALLDRLRAAP
jgi:hypothetical protein